MSFTASGDGGPVLQYTQGTSSGQWMGKIANVDQTFVEK